MGVLSLGSGANTTSCELGPVISHSFPQQNLLDLIVNGTYSSPHKGGAEGRRIYDVCLP